MDKFEEYLIRQIQRCEENNEIHTRHKFETTLVVYQEYKKSTYNYKEEIKFDPREIFV